MVPTKELVMIDQELLKILVCPETKQDLRLAESAFVEKINLAIGKGTLRNRSGQGVTQKIEGALIRSDEKYFYPIRDGIPIMLIDEAIALEAIRSL